MTRFSRPESKPVELSGNFALDMTVYIFEIEMSLSYSCYECFFFVCFFLSFRVQGCRQINFSPSSVWSFSECFSDFVLESLLWNRELARSSSSLKSESKGSILSFCVSFVNSVLVGVRFLLFLLQKYVSVDNSESSNRNLKIFLLLIYCRWYTKVSEMEFCL